MHDEKHDRRVQRTRKLLRGALVQLVKEQGYDPVTIQDITERANLGRTTFYLHYDSKEALLLDHHADMHARLGLTPLDRNGLLGDAPQPEMISFLQLMAHNRPMYHAIRSAKESDRLLRGIAEQMAVHLRGSLETIFPDQQPELPIEVLVEYVVGAQLSLIHWWMSNRTPYDAEQMAALLHQLRRGAIRDAYRQMGDC